MKKSLFNSVLLKIILTVFFSTFFYNFSFAQPGLPQRTITVQATQPIDFGKFVVTGAGTITVDWQGNRTATGGVIIVNSSTVQPAIFDVTLCQGRNVTITYNPTINLIGSDGGSLDLNVGDTEKGPSGTTFAVDSNCNFVTTLRVGGTLNVPGGSPSGTYTGTFDITFQQE